MLTLRRTVSWHAENYGVVRQLGPDHLLSQRERRRLDGAGR